MPPGHGSSLLTASEFGSARALPGRPARLRRTRLNLDRYGTAARQPRMPAIGNITECGCCKADSQLRESFVALSRAGRQPSVEHDGHISTAAALVLPDNRPR